MEKELDLLPFVVEALGKNSKIYIDIDKLYQTNKYEFYTVAKEHPLYTHPIVTEGSLIQEEYCKKILGIVVVSLMNEDIKQQLYQLIYKAYKWTYLYVENHKIINFIDYTKAFIKKFKKFDANDNLIDWNISIMLILAKNNGDELIINEELNKFFNMLMNRNENYAGTVNTSINIEKLSPEEMQKICNLKKSVYHKYGTIKNYNDILRNTFVVKKMQSCLFLFDYEDLSSELIFQNISITDKDINMILYLYIISNRNLSDIEAATEFLIVHMYILYQIKAYKQVKQMYFNNNKETMYIELESLEKSLNITSEQLSIAKKDLYELQNKYKLLEKENENLKTELEQEKRNRQELNSLREFVFNLDNKEEFTSEEEFDKESLKGFKAIIIGGHEKWQQRMKGHLPNFTFIHPDNKNFDVRLLDGASCLFIFTNYINHGIYYKAMEAVERKEIKIIYLNNQNEDLVLKEINKKFCPNMRKSA